MLNSRGFRRFGPSGCSALSMCAKVRCLSRQAYRVGNGTGAEAWSRRLKRWKHWALLEADIELAVIRCQPAVHGPVGVYADCFQCLL